MSKKYNSTSAGKNREPIGVKNVVFSILMWVLSILVLYPLAMVIVTSLKTKSEANGISMRLPKEMIWSNYGEVIRTGKIFTALTNSLFVSVISTAIVLALASMISYAIVRRDTKGCRMIDKLLTFGIIAPFAAMPTMKLLSMMGLYGSHWGLIFTYSALYLPFSSMMITSYIKGIPKDLDEAGVIDGASGMSLFIRIIVPVLKPIVATVGILVFMWSWNELQVPLYLLNSADKYTLPMSMFNFNGLTSKNWQLVCADVILVSMPVVVLYLFAQKYVIAGMTAGAVKM